MAIAQEKIIARLFVASALGEGALLELSGNHHHYLAHSLRAEAGQRAALFNGREGEWRAIIRAIGKKSVTVEAELRLRMQYDCPDIQLAFAPVKNEKIDFTVRRATELGVSALLPVITQRTVVTRINTDRLRANAIEAAEQCGRMDIPLLHPPQKLETMLSQWPPERTMLHCDETGKGMPFHSLLPGLDKGKYAVLIGPEGGFSPEERQRLASLPYAKAVSLGPRILRAETAALAALANLMAWAGDWEERPAFS
ncbi:MAG: 16S rRNA (uracil(1498)-N(3))-methyltransferase [Alphaproteobacteria bacterium]|nr:16S rRNA (uracil(1498)-N(3))-methyltransferase [Alphaproteobacteria bacterium]